MPPVSELVPVQDMAVLSPRLWWTFKRGRGMLMYCSWAQHILILHFRQMNVDYAICGALKYQSVGLPQALVIYDIGCQWIINFKRRLAESSHLSIPEDIELLVAVGKFHLTSYVRQCFARYSLNFVQGSGQVDGEILETLWSPFNFISAPARTMSMASRHQLYDDHMRDSNWKKIVNIGGRNIHL
jgi:hypothetical protein